MYIPWLPHAGQTELTQVVLAVWGTYVNLRLLFNVTIDAIVARRDDPASDDTDRVAMAAVYGQMTLTTIQLLVLVTGACSLVLPPPPPPRFEDMWLSLDPRAVMWVIQHLGLMITSIVCVIGGHLAERERKRILAPQRIQQHARRAVLAGEHAAPTASLLEQIGGEVALDGIAADLYARLVRDPMLRPYFIGAHVKRLQHAQAVMMATLLSGGIPQVDLRAAHAHLDITSEHFTRLVQHLRDTLHFFDVAPALSAQVLAMVESTRDQIVTRASNV